MLRRQAVHQKTRGLSPRFFHEFEVATNQQDAQQLLKSMDFDYVLLDLQIPAKANRGGADKQYGINLLKDIQRMKAPSPPPVIMMTAHLADGFNLSSELQRNGVRECIAKPFSDAARPLSSVILAVVEEYGPKAKTIETPKPASNVVVHEVPVIEMKRFSGGELVFKHDRITLCGQTIFYYSRSKQTTRILEALNVKTQTGTWIAKSGTELVDELGSASGQKFDHVFDSSVSRLGVRSTQDSAGADLREAGHHFQWWERIPIQRLDHDSGHQKSRG